MTEPLPSRHEQLKRALQLGAIDQDTFDAAAAAISAQLAGSGAIAQGAGAIALGAGSAYLRNNQGTINFSVLIQNAAKPGASEEDLRRAYLARILTKANQLPFAGDTGGSQVRLSSVYTALLTQRSDAEEFAGAINSRMEPRAGRTHLSALDVLNSEQRLVLLGGPGSGKSTFVNIVALSMAGELLGLAGPNLATLTAPLPSEKAGDEEPRPQRWDHRALLPVQVVLRDLASSLPTPGAAVNAETAWAFIGKQLADAALAEFVPYLRAHLLREGGLVLLDGLDEVPDALNRREQIMQLVQDFAATFSKCRFLVTSRTYAYQRQPWDKDDRHESWKLANFADVQLLPFTQAQMHGFIDAWFAHMVELSRLSPGDADGRANLLKRAIDRNPRLAELAERPLLLTLIARLHSEGGGALPEKREELYMQAVDLLLNQWEGLKVRYQADGSKVIEPSLAEWLNADRDAIRCELDKLAFEAHRDQADLVGTANIRQRDLIAALLAADPRDRERKLSRLEEHLSDRAGLLAAHGVGYYQFPHRSFQEYLAACHLTVDRFPDELGRLLRADPNRWREVTLLAAAKAARGASDSVWNLVEALILKDEPPGQAAPAPESADLWGALLAGQALWETGLAVPSANTVPRNEKKRLRVQRWLRAIVERGWLPPVDRALAGRALSVLGDDRDFDELVAIGAGEFRMGDDDDDDDSAKPRHQVHLKAFKIGKYLVTNGQYRHFADATGRKWASADGDKADKRNHPASVVSWHDARAYCEWLTGDWRKSGKIGASDSFALPSEAEWERAARGGDGHLYPWGDTWREDCANIDETGIGDASAVGSFVGGKSEAGCLDMAGNVWEWTRSLWGTDFRKPEFRYPYDPEDGKRENLNAKDEVLRVVRGGSWYDDRNFARYASRVRLGPDFRFNFVGFRVVLRSAPVS